MAKLTYAAYVSEQLRPYSKQEQQTMRKHYWGERERVYRYDTYATYAKVRNLTYDDPPELYAELMEQPWHKPVVGAVFCSRGIYLVYRRNNTWVTWREERIMNKAQLIDATLFRLARGVRRQTILARG